MAARGPNADQPGAVAWRAIEPHWKSVNIYDGPILFQHDYDQLSETVQHLFAVWWCDHEVCNGGFHQFFSNSTGVLAPEAVMGFRAIGLGKCAELAQAAISRFGEPYPRDRGTRQTVLQALRLSGEIREQWDPFQASDDRYYVLREELRFSECLDTYARHSGC